LAKAIPAVIGWCAIYGVALYIWGDNVSYPYLILTLIVLPLSVYIYEKRHKRNKTETTDRLRNEKS
jgi:hypothetical protein